MLRVGHHFFFHVGVFDAAFCCGSARGAGSHGTIRGRGGGPVYGATASLFCPYAGNIASAFYTAARGMQLARRGSSTRDIYIEIFDFVMCILARLPKK